MTISHREPVAAALARVPGRLMVAVPHTDHSEPVERGRADELAVLYEIIHTVTSTLDVEAVLAAIVRLVNDAIVAHATYIFLAEEGGRRIVLRAASERYAHLCGCVSMGAGEGIAGWVLENRQPVFINENVLSDPRVKYFPELEEEKYQSLVSVPLVLKGDRMIGVIALHAEAPRVFSAEDAAFLIHVASLVAQAIENARLYEHTRRSLRELEHLSRLGSAIARAESIDELLASAVEVGRTLVRAESLGVYLVEASGDSLRLRAAAGGDVEGPEVVSLPDLGVELRRNGAPGGASLTSVLAGTLWGAPAMRSALVAPLVAGEEVLGFLVARLVDGRRASEHDRDLANSLASQTAVGLKRLQLTDRLAERNRIKDLFDDLAAGIGGPALAGRARRLGIDPEAPHLVVWCAPPRDGARAPTAAEEQGFGVASELLEAAVVRLAPGSLADRREDSLRLLVPLRGVAENALLERIEGLVDELPSSVAAGFSSVCSGPRAYAAGMAEAHQAALAVPVIRPGARRLRYDELGLYKYLLRVPLDEHVRDRRSDALRALRDHDRRRQSQLLRTLEEFLRQRGNMAATAKALYVHPNTLRQRLRRIGEIAGIDPRADDWLMLEIACKLLKLEEVYPSERSTS
jgi:GAF domain-containing protein